MIALDIQAEFHVMVKCLENNIVTLLFLAHLVKQVELVGYGTVSVPHPSSIVNFCFKTVAHLMATWIVTIYDLKHNCGKPIIFYINAVCVTPFGVGH